MNWESCKYDNLKPALSDFLATWEQQKQAANTALCLITLLIVYFCAFKKYDYVVCSFITQLSDCVSAVSKLHSS